MLEKLMNDKPIVYNGYSLNFYATKYQFGEYLAIICDDSDGYQYANVSQNLIDWGYLTGPNEIFFNHDLPKDFKELFCENFCDCTLSSCEKIKFGPYDTETEKAVILDKYLSPKAN